MKNDENLRVSFAETLVPSFVSHMKNDENFRASFAEAMAPFFISCMRNDENLRSSFAEALAASVPVCRHVYDGKERSRYGVFPHYIYIYGCRLNDPPGK